ncbi:MAG: hypothetical protein AAF434_15650 [Pseudomonadota bacterium]
MTVKSYPVLIPLVAGLFFLLGYLGAFQAIGKSATYWFNAYAEAELRKLEVAGFHNERGEPEYVVSIVGDESDGRGFLSSQSAVTDVRETLFDGWFVISMKPGSTQSLEKIRSSEQVDFVLPNRGVWFCH